MPTWYRLHPLCHITGRRGKTLWRRHPSDGLVRQLTYHCRLGLAELGEVGSETSVEKEGWSEYHDRRATDEVMEVHGPIAVDQFID